MKNLKRAILVLAASALGAVLSGCVVTADGHLAGVVVVPFGHVHSEFCGHYWCDGGWYISSGHHHGPGCGHLYIEGRWTLYRDSGRHRGHVKP